MSDIVALLRHRSMEKTAAGGKATKGLYDTVTKALSTRGIHPIGAMAGTAVGGVGGAIQGYQNADEDSKLQGALAGGVLGGAGGGLVGHTLGQAHKNLQGISGKLDKTKKEYEKLYKTKHDMGFWERLTSRFTEAGRKKLEIANKKYEKLQAPKTKLLEQHQKALADQKLKIQNNPNLSYDEQVKQINKLYQSNAAGRHEAVRDTVKGSIFGPALGAMTGGALYSSGTSAFSPADPEAVVQSLQSKKNLSEQDKFILNEKLKKIRAKNQGTSNQSSNAV